MNNVDDFGEVTIGEIGELKTEIAFTKDVLNTRGRVQRQYKELNSYLMVSGAVKGIVADE